MRRLLPFFLLLAFLWSPTALAQLNLLQSESKGEFPEIQFLTQTVEETSQEVAQIRSLFYRESWSFGPETLSKVWLDLEHLPELVRSHFRRLLEHQWQQQDLFWLGLVLLTLLFGIVSIWLDRRIQRFPGKVLKFLPKHTPFWLHGSSKILLVVLGRLLLILGLLFIVHIVWGAFTSERRYFPLLKDLLWIFLIYRGVHAALHEILIQEKEQFFRAVSMDMSKRLYYRLYAFTLFTTFFWMMISALKNIGYHSDFIELLNFIYSGSLFIFATYLISRKDDIFGLFPELDEPVYQRLILLFRRFYLYIVSFTLLLGLFWISGYRHLAEVLFMRSWALVALVLVVRLLHRLVRNLLSAYLSQEHSKLAKESKLIQAILRALTVLEILVLIHGVLYFLGIRTPLLNFLNQPMASIGGKSVISALSFVNGMISLLLFWMTTQIINAFLEERVFPTRFNAGIHQMITMTVFYIVMAFGCLMALNIIGIDLSIFAIFAGALAFGIGFGLQGIAKNFASGLILIFTGLVKKGDYITISGETGYIQDVSWKKVLLRTPDHVDLIIPTVALVESTITNWSYSDKEVRVHLPVGVSYASDMVKVKQALLEAASEHAEVMQKPAPDVWMVGFGNSSVDFELLVWIDCSRIPQERLRGELNFMIWNALKRYEIEIPFPQRDLHIRSGLEHLNPDLA